MDAKRILKHLWTGRLQARRLFPASALDAITAAIATAESKHHGEIRFAIEASLHLRPLLEGVTSRVRALQVFSDLGVWDTEANSGVLIYLLLADRKVEIVADRGVHGKVGGEGWDEVRRAMEAEFRQGRFEAGALAGIAKVGEYLETHFPRRGPDANELPDRPVLL